ncbi:hypothetical protein GW750_02930 [bacterium]|nr:hypothetical protein [bacterium]
MSASIILSVERLSEASNKRIFIKYWINTVSCAITRAIAGFSFSNHLNKHQIHQNPIHPINNNIHIVCTDILAGIKGIAKNTCAPSNMSNATLEIAIYCSTSHLYCHIFPALLLATTSINVLAIHAKIVQINANSSQFMFFVFGKTIKRIVNSRTQILFYKKYFVYL